VKVYTEVKKAYEENHGRRQKRRHGQTSHYRPESKELKEAIRQSKELALLGPGGGGGSPSPSSSTEPKKKKKKKKIGQLKTSGAMAYYVEYWEMMHLVERFMADPGTKKVVPMMLKLAEEGNFEMALMRQVDSRVRSGFLILHQDSMR